MINVETARQMLLDGNQRFLDAGFILTDKSTPSHMQSLASGQTPFAVIVACSDSRVPPEIIFDQGLGQLFVIRVAGNIITPEVQGSVEYAVVMLGCRLVVVLGHTRCGAVEAAISSSNSEIAGLPAGLRSVVTGVQANIDLSSDAAVESPGDGMVRACAIANSIEGARVLETTSTVLSQKSTEGEVSIVPALYDIETGIVTFLD